MNLKRAQRKFIPVLVIVGVFCGFLASQVLFDLFNSEAGISSKERSLNAYYSAELSRLKVKTTEQKILDLSRDMAPIVIVNFWASWCRPCLVEFPSLVYLQEKLGKEKLKVIGINMDAENQAQKIKEIVSEFEVNFDIVPDQADQLSGLFKVTSLPASFVFIKGKFFRKLEGGFNYGDRDFLTKLESELR